MPKRVDPNEGFMVERREKAEKWMVENGKKHKLTSKQQSLDINNNMNNYYVPAPWKTYNKSKICNQLFGVQLEWLQELLEVQGYTGKLSIVSLREFFQACKATSCSFFVASLEELTANAICVPQDSGGSRSDSDRSDSDDEESKRGSGAKLSGRKHKSDTVLENDETKKSGGSSGEGSGNGLKPVMITPAQLQALQTPGASLFYQPGKHSYFENAQEPSKLEMNAFLRLKIDWWALGKL